MIKNKAPTIEVSIVIPAYNEAKLILKTLKDTIEFARGNIKNFEIIVVAAKGTDNTAEIASKFSKKNPEVKIITHPSRVGKGRDVRSGILAAIGHKIIFMDADLATPLYHLLPMIDQLSESEVVIGIRNINKMHNNLIRKFSSKLAHGAISTLAIRGIEDTQCGFKGFQSSAATKIFSNLKSQGWGFDFEVLALAKKFKYNIAKILIADWHDPKGSDGLAGDSQFLAMKNTFTELIILRKNIIFKKYQIK